MKRFNRREQTILKMMALVIGIALLLDLNDRYQAHKETLIDEIDSKRSQISTYLKELEGKDAEKYNKDAQAIAEELEGVQGKVLALPKEEDASLLIRETISETAETAGMTINSISSRKSREVSEDTELLELRTYFGFDTDLRALLLFFESFEQENYYIVIESLNISARRQPRRRNNARNRKRPTNARQKSPLNGNAVLASVFVADPNSTVKKYARNRSAGGAAKPNADAKPKTDTKAKDNTQTAPAAKPDHSAESAALEVMGAKSKTQPEAPELKPQPRAAEPPKTGVTNRPGRLNPKPRPLTDTADPKKPKTKFRM